MTNLLKVQEADEGASEQATETRQLLQAWADKHLPDVPADVVQALTAEEVKVLCAAGALNMLNSTMYLGRYAEAGSWAPSPDTPGRTHRSRWVHRVPVVRLPRQGISQRRGSTRV